ncbi:Glutamate receptor ionotropic, kainate 5 [Frankliniella fusca]|uniref:Glutamate receptor ionotropic, kainate 5 n=1 Tax=Frankliniella fusca TaxID=407009 RepID=A0AAE1HD40_9NEOP|nr:Glutamate receptor ionotropic, kainate 5 [Frankliniella fusca]
MTAARSGLGVLAQLLPLACSALLAVPADSPRDGQRRQVDECVVDLQRRLFPSTGQVTVVSAAGRGLELRGLRAPRLLLSAEDMPSGALPTYNYATDLYVVDQLGLGNDTLSAVLDALPQYSRTAVILVMAEAVLADAAVAALWSRNLVNAAVLATSRAGVEAYSYTAFSRCDAAPPAQLLGTWTKAGAWAGRAAAAGRAPLFPRNAHLRLGGCTLHCGTAESPSAVMLDGNDTSTASGFVIAMLREFGARMQFGTRFQSATDGLLWGWAYENATGTGILGDVLANRSHMGAGAFLPLHNRDVVLDLTRSAEFMCMTWAFSPALWTSLLLVAAACSVVTWFLSARVPADWGLRARGRFARYPFVAFYTLSTLVAIPRGRVPRLGPLRAFLLSWFFFALVMTTAYIASLKTLLDDPWLPGEINTVQEILDSGLDVEMHPNMQASLEELGEENATLAELARRAVLERYVETSVMQHVARDRAAVSLQSRTALQYYASLLSRGRRGQKMLHVFPKYCLLNLPTAYIVLRKGAALTPSFNELIGRAVETGLVQHWRDMKRKRHRADGDEKPPVILGKEHLVGVWLLLVVGEGAAVVAFIGELLVFRNRARVDAVLARLGEQRQRRRARAELRRRRRQQRRFSRLTGTRTGAEAEARIGRPQPLGDVVAPALAPPLPPPGCTDADAHHEDDR